MLLNPYENEDGDDDKDSCGGDDEDGDEDHEVGGGGDSDDDDEEHEGDGAGGSGGDDDDGEDDNKKIFLEHNYVPAIVLSNEDIKLKKGALPTLPILARTQYCYSLSKGGGVTSSYSHNWQVLVS